jgi:hypothetical protein
LGCKPVQAVIYGGLIRETAVFLSALANERKTLFLFGLSLLILLRTIHCLILQIRPKPVCGTYMKMRSSLNLFLLLFLFLAVASNVLGSPGDLDPTFSFDGISRDGVGTDTYNEGKSGAVQPMGKSW